MVTRPTDDDGFIRKIHSGQSKTHWTQYLVLIGTMASGAAFAQNKSVVATHCTPDERIVFSCPFKHGKTASLCASSDLTKTTGTLQYRYGVVGKKPELVFPQLGTHENPIYDHPSWNFYLYANTRWATANVPPGDSVSIHMTFTPVEGRPDVNFVIDAQAGPESRYRGTMLTIYESGGQGRTIAEHRCIKEKTTEDLFSLKDIIQK
ncbi:MAG: hypothetical protein V4713_00745 [Pseudomonadota bacterium]